MRSPIDSPFSPGADNVPPVWAGRTTHLADWRDVVRPRRLAGHAERGRTILGEAGLGKSSLVRRIAEDAASRGDWVTPQLRIPSGADPLKRLAAALLDLADQAGLTTRTDQRVGALLQAVSSVEAAGVSLALRAQEGPEPYTVLTALLVEIGHAALRSGDRLALVHIDEIQNITSEQTLSQLLIALGDALAHEVTVAVPGGYGVARTLPVAVYLTGLPEFADMAGARKGATFARRFRTTALAPIADDAFAAALQPFVTDGWPIHGEGGEFERVWMEPAARDAIVDLSRGEPFLFQLAGAQAWYAGIGRTITHDEVLTGWRTAEPEAEAHVLRILDRLPGRERDFVEAMAELDPSERTLTRIAERAGHAQAAAAGPTSRRLDLTRGIISRGKPYTFRHRAIEAYLTSSWPRVG